jgi:hypothetical protein
MGEKMNAYRIGSQAERDHEEDLHVGGKNILKYVLET